jgi:hypothetical protein
MMVELGVGPVGSVPPFARPVPEPPVTQVAQAIPGIEATSTTTRMGIARFTLRPSRGWMVGASLALRVGSGPSRSPRT